MFRGRSQRRIAETWLRALRDAAKLPKSELPDPSPQHDGPPPPNRWADRDPAAAARLTAVRAGLATIAEENRLPIENLLQPDLVRRTCWRPPEPLSGDAVAGALRAGGAREWQIALTVDALSTALNGTGG